MINIGLIAHRRRHKYADTYSDYDARGSHKLFFALHRYTKNAKWAIWWHQHLENHGFMTDLKTLTRFSDFSFKIKNILTFLNS